METSTYNPCLLITKDKDIFRIVGMQTNDTIILANKKFSKLKKKELIFITKLKKKLTPKTPIIFNSCVLTQNSNTLTLH